MSLSLACASKRIVAPVKPDIPDHWQNPKYEVLDKGVVACKDGWCKILLNDFMRIIRNHGKCESIRRAFLEIIDNPTYEER